MTPSTPSSDADPASRLARQRLQVERALVRFVIGERLVPFEAIARFFERDERIDPVTAVLTGDDPFPDHVFRHFALLATLEIILLEPERRAGDLAKPAVDTARLKPASLKVGHDLAARGAEIAPDLLQLVGHRQALFLRVAELSDDPHAIWQLARSILDGSETVH